MTPADGDNLLEPQIVRIENDGTLRFDRNVGAANGGRQVRVTLELLPQVSDFRGSRRHILDLVSADDFIERMNTLIAANGIAVAESPCEVPNSHQNPAYGRV
jgi:hypothetical protein